MQNNKSKCFGVTYASYPSSYGNLFIQECFPVFVYLSDSCKLHNKSPPSLTFFRTACPYLQTAHIAFIVSFFMKLFKFLIRAFPLFAFTCRSQIVHISDKYIPGTLKQACAVLHTEVALFLRCRIVQDRILAVVTYDDHIYRI